MQKPKPVKIQTPQKPVRRNWIKFITDDNVKLAIPVGQTFQADVPDWRGDNWNSELDTSRWLGTKIWPIRGNGPETNDNAIGKGRPESCKCVTPGSIECVKQHVTDKRNKLQDDLGTAFRKWKFDTMGEDVSKLWKLNEEKKFAVLVKKNPKSQGKSFVKPALKSFPSHSRQTIANYYFNVFVPRRIAIRTRSGSKNVGTDDDEAEDSPNSRGSQKRVRADSVGSSSPEIVQSSYLSGRR